MVLVRTLFLTLMSGMCLCMTCSVLVTPPVRWLLRSLKPERDSSVIPGPTLKSPRCSAVRSAVCVTLLVLGLIRIRALRKKNMFPLPVIVATVVGVRMLGLRLTMSSMRPSPERQWLIML